MFNFKKQKKLKIPILNHLNSSFFHSSLSFSLILSSLFHPLHHNILSLLPVYLCFCIPAASRYGKSHFPLSLMCSHSDTLWSVLTLLSSKVVKSALPTASLPHPSCSTVYMTRTDLDKSPARLLTPFYLIGSSADLLLTLFPS